MENVKHVGRVISSGRKVLVAYRTLPGDAFNCLVIATESLQDSYHDALINLVETEAAQQSFEFAEILNRSTFPDGSNMLISLHHKGYLKKVPTSDIEMQPSNLSSVRLDELNHQIAQIRGVSVQDLAIRPDAPSDNVRELAQVHNMDTRPKPTEEPLSDEQLARKYRDDAARLLREVEELNKMAEHLAPVPKAPVQEPVATIQEPVAIVEQNDTITAEKPTATRGKRAAKA
jgi:hypothetical protein